LHSNKASPEAKEKKKRLPLRRSFANIFFALRQVWEVSPSYFIVYYAMTFVWGTLDFLEGSFLLRLIVNGVEKNTPTRTIVTFMLIIAIADTAPHTSRILPTPALNGPDRRRAVSLSIPKRSA
jgi:hypothetical protein